MLIKHDDAGRSQRARCAALLQGAAWAPAFELQSDPAPLDARGLWSELIRLAGDVRKLPCELEGRLLLLRFAPTALSLGVSLRPWLQVARGHSALGAACLDEMHRVLGSGVTARAQSRLYTGLLAAHGLSSADTLASLVNDSSLEDGDFRCVRRPWGSVFPEQSSCPKPWVLLWGRCSSALRPSSPRC